MELSAQWPVIPDVTETDPLVGRSNVLRSELGDIREQTVAFMLAKRTLERWSRLSGETNDEPVTLFPQFLSLAKQWLRECLHLKDGRSAGFLSYTALRDEAVQKMITACADTLETAGQEKIRSVVAADPSGSSRFVDFHTTRNTLMATDPAKSQINYVLWESTWEAAFAERIEKLDRVRGYVKNNGLGFEVPYTFMGDERSYRPDFIVQVDDGRPDPLHVVVEIKGFRGPDAQAKHDALMRLWLPAVNNDGRWGRWHAMEIVVPTDMTIQFSEKVWAEPKQGEAALQLIAERLDETVKQAAEPDCATAA